MRSGSYCFNFWLMGKDIVGGYDSYYPAGLTNFFEGDLRVQPAVTPVLSDGIYYFALPKATDSAPDSLVYGFGYYTRGFMSHLSIPHHGRRPSKAPLTWPSDKPLPGTINVSFYDGHVEQVPLDNLWQLNWHANYQPPAKRPGLP